MKIDFTHLLSHFSEVQLHTLFKKREAAKRKILQKKEEGDMVFFDLPYQKDHSSLQKYAKLFAPYNTLLIIGIGGSSLGAKAAIQALGNPSRKKIYFLENPNPAILEILLQKIDLKKTAVNIVSKSGSTLETLSLFFILFEKLKKLFGYSQLKERIIITTELKKNFLCHTAQKFHLPILPIPSNVSGRYSVLSPVGLFPMLLSGIDIEALLKGAQWIDQNRKDPYLYATLAYGIHQIFKKPLSVLFLYDERLSFFGDWFCQLWAESLAKSEASGPSPLKAIGPSDQHSLLQLFLQGPRDKWFTTIGIIDYQTTLKIPNSKILNEYSYLKNIPLEKIIQAEQKTTEESLIQFLNPLCKLTLPHLSAFTLGSLFYYFELAATMAGYLYEINPFDQPAVEEGKHLARKMLQNKEF